MRSWWILLAMILSVTAITLIAADEIIRQSDDDPKTAAAIRELVRRGAVVKRFAVAESDTAGLLVRLKSEHLDQHGQISNEILTELSSLKDLALELRGLPLSDAGLKPVLKKLKLISLDASGSKISDRGLLDLPSQQTSLRMLDLSFTKLSDTGLKPVTTLRELRHLSLIDCRVTDDSIEGLARLSRVREIYLSKTDVSEKAAEQLRRTLSTCRVER